MVMLKELLLFLKIHEIICDGCFSCALMAFILLYKTLACGVFLIKCAFLFGVLAERLGRGLQNLLQRFESARRLKNHNILIMVFLFKKYSPS